MEITTHDGMAVQTDQTLSAEALAQEIEARHFNDLPESRRLIVRQLIREQHAEATRELLRDETTDSTSLTNLTLTPPDGNPLPQVNSSIHARPGHPPLTGAATCSDPPLTGDTGTRNAPSTRINSPLSIPPTTQGTTSKPSGIMLNTNIPIETLRNVMKRANIVTKSKPPNTRISHIKGPTKGNQLIIYTDDHQDWHRLMVRENWDQSEFSFSPRIQDAFTVGRTVVIRGVDLEIPLDMVQNKLTELGFSPSNVTRMEIEKDHDRRSTLCVAATFNSQKDYDKFLALGTIIIQFKEMLLVPFSKERPTQCYVCQEYGHTQKDCTNQVKCLKCSGNHRRDACPNPENLRCANCSEVHPANDRSCQAYIREIRRLRSQGLSKTKPFGQGQRRATFEAEPKTNPWKRQENQPRAENAETEAKLADQPKARLNPTTSSNLGETAATLMHDLLPALVSLMKTAITMIKYNQETGKFDTDKAISLIEEWENKFTTYSSQTGANEQFPNLNSTTEPRRQRRPKIAPFDRKKAVSLSRLIHIENPEVDLSDAADDDDFLPEATLERGNLELAGDIDSEFQSPQKETPSSYSTADSPSSTGSGASLPNTPVQPVFSLQGFKPLDNNAKAASSPKRKTSADAQDDDGPPNKVQVSQSTTGTAGNKEQDNRENDQEVLVIGHGPEGPLTATVTRSHNGPLEGVPLGSKQQDVTGKNQEHTATDQRKHRQQKPPTRDTAESTQVSKRSGTNRPQGTSTPVSTKETKGTPSDKFKKGSSAQQIRGRPINKQ